MQKLNPCILVADNDTNVPTLRRVLETEKYQVITASNGFEAIDLAGSHIPQLIILDIMMPGMDGIETCEKLRENPNLKNTLITYFTARNEDYSQIAGFEAGADDYITKPVKPRLLISKVMALLRRLETHHSNSSIIGTGDLRIDTEKYQVIYKDTRYVFPKKEFEILTLLVSKPNRVFMREEIYDKIWGSEVVVGERTIDVYIRKIREKLGTEKIVTIKGVGYKYEE